jgi:hypothetical protein
MSRLAAVLALGLLAACGTTEPLAVDPDQPWKVDTTGTVATVPIASQTNIPPNYGIHDTYIRDGLAFVCAWNTGLMIYDVGNGVKGGSPSSPVLISTAVTNDNGVPGGRAVHNAWWFHNPVSGQNKYVFVGQEGPATIPSNSTGDIHVVDVSDLNNPVEVAFYHMNVNPAAGTHNFWMDESAQILYAAYYNAGVVALDVSGTLSGDLAAREIARYKPSGTMFTWGVQLANNSVYLVDMLNGFYQLKFLNGTFTTAAGGNNVSDRYGSDLWVNSQYAYTGTWGGTPRGNNEGNAIKIWQLSASGAPSLADSIVFVGFNTVSDVKGSTDGKVLVASAEAGPWGGLYVFSLSNPARPALVGRVKVTGGLHTVKIADINGRHYVFAAKNRTTNNGSVDSPPQLMVFDITGMVP